MIGKKRDADVEHFLLDEKLKQGLGDRPVGTVLLSRHEDLGSGPGPHGEVVCACSPSAGKAEKWGTLGLPSQPASSTQQTSGQ